MAGMIPGTRYAENDSEAERDLYELFRRGLDDSFTVLHSLRWVEDRRGRLREGECDFLIAHPRYGLLAVEAKTGHLELRNGRWYQNGKGIKSPLAQASRTIHFLERRLRADLGWRLSLPYGYAVAFPHLRLWPGPLPADASKAIMMLEADALHPQEWVIGALAAWSQPDDCLSPERFRDLLGHLCPEVNLVPDLHTRLQYDQEELLRLTRQQAMTLHLLSRVPRAIVEGCAGSGKTLMAIEKASQLARAGQRVLLLSFTRPLAHQFRHLAGDNLDACTFHQLCLHGLRACGINPPTPHPDDSDYWNVQLPRRFFHILDRWETRYDAIIVDEAQDFCPHWWQALRVLLADPEDGVLFAFRDARQNLFRRQHHIPIDAPVYPLLINCRNTGRIAAYVRQLAGDHAQPLFAGSHGEAPAFHLVHDDGDERRRIAAILQQLVDTHGLPGHRITILGQHSWANSLFADNPRLADFRVRHENVEPHSREIRYSSIYRFKGLEDDAIILCALRPDQRFSPAHLRYLHYVAASRARFILHICRRPDSPAEIPAQS